MTVMLVSFLGTVGIALPYPVLAPYFIDYPANNLTHFMGFHPKILLGISLAIYPLGMLIGSMFIGALSDHYGRRKVLLITLCGAVISYLLTTLAIYQESFVFFIIARLITGICEGNISIARAIAAELHPQINRTRALSLIYTSTYTGWMLGPVFGGFLMGYGIANIFMLAGIGMLVSVVLVYFMVAKDRIDESQEFDFLYTLKTNNSLTLLKHKSIVPVFWFYFLYSMGLNAFYDFYPVWFVDHHQSSGQVIGIATVSLTIMMIIISSLIVTAVQKKYGEIRTMITGGFTLALLLSIQPFLGFYQTFVIFILIGATIALTNGMIPSYLSTYFGHLGQGKVMGLQTTTFCITNVMIATGGGVLSILDSIFILLLGAFFIFCSVVVLFKNRASLLSLKPEDASNT